MKLEKSQQITQKYKGSQETTIRNCFMSIKWTTWKKWANSQKSITSKNEPEETQNLNRPITSTEIFDFTFDKGCKNIQWRKRQSL